jgi:diguanylate cyclase (GGDEF)-like protein
MKFFAEKEYLTNIYNRRFGQKIFPKLKAKMNKDKSSFGVFVVDINNFKKLNDIYGHEIGDNVLKNIAKLLLRNTRKNDVVIRWGGDEFVILAPTFNNKDADILITRIEESLKDKIKKYEDVKLGLSIGYSIYPVNGEDLDDMLRVADAYMYKVKIKKQGTSN